MNVDREKLNENRKQRKRNDGLEFGFPRIAQHYFTIQFVALEKQVGNRDVVMSLGIADA